MPFTVPPSAYKWIFGGLGFVIILATIYFAINAYGKSEREAGYKEGVSDTDIKWEAAFQEMQDHADVAIEEATTAAEAREHAYEEATEEEREKIDEATRQGTDPFDVMFPSR